MSRTVTEIEKANNQEKKRVHFLGLRSIGATFRAFKTSVPDTLSLTSLLISKHYVERGSDKLPEYLRAMSAVTSICVRKWSRGSDSVY